MRCAAHFLSTRALLLAAATVAPVYAEEAKPASTAPSAEHIERAIQLGNRFQAMAPRQNQPQSAAPIPQAYTFTPRCYDYRVPLRYGVPPYWSPCDSDSYPYYRTHYHGDFRGPPLRRPVHRKHREYSSGNRD